MYVLVYRNWIPSFLKTKKLLSLAKTSFCLFSCIMALLVLWNLYLLPPLFKTEEADASNCVSKN
jgi:hypothetical protein